MKPVEVTLTDDAVKVVSFYLTTTNLRDVLDQVGVIAWDRLNHPSRSADALSGVSETHRTTEGQ